MLLIIIPTVGINFNTHICGQTKEVSKSLVIPGLLSPKECDKCHQVVVVKSCCSNKGDEKKVEDNDHGNDEGCCEDILEYSSFDYLTIAPFVQDLVSSSSTFAIAQSNFHLGVANTSHRIFNYKIRLRPYVVDILPLKCSYLI